MPCGTSVLNLLSQVGIYLSVLPHLFWLTHPLQSSNPLYFKCWLKTLVTHHEHSRVFTTNILPQNPQKGKFKLAVITPFLEF
jgi:hypothetical protein